ncbi:hypothetical protein [Cetobacterium sp.]|uniref:hypothetical protein n=1 Tax=Cetobacterium sp. TaxID=2071632 RepID=UPI003F2F5649
MSYTKFSKKNTLSGCEDEFTINFDIPKPYILNLKNETFLNNGIVDTLEKIIKESIGDKKYVSISKIGDIIENLTLDNCSELDSSKKHTRKTLVTNFKAVLDKMGGVEKYISEAPKYNSIGEIYIDKKYIYVAIFFMVEASTKETYLYQLISDKRSNRIDFEDISTFYFNLKDFLDRYYDNNEVDDILEAIDKFIDFTFSKRRIEIKHYFNHLWDILNELHYEDKISMANSIYYDIQQFYYSLTKTPELSYGMESLEYKFLLERLNSGDDELTRAQEELYLEFPKLGRTQFIEKEIKDRVLYFFKSNF